MSFSYKRPFGCESGQPQLVRPHRLGELFPHQMLYVLRHYVYDGLQLPVFTALSGEIQHDLEDVDSIDFHEHAYILIKIFRAVFTLWILAIFTAIRMRLSSPSMLL
ncbi:hypothetical protein RA11412_1480 [Rothia aeria]|uniref:Uncharacterized protein n=1 Tax=Rothia aeria TaxID=172042 RepID=A0A2Z5R3Q0_9MICC|nr:hypothetical protein RA11412_1480 [Rothia aeria]